MAAKFHLAHKWLLKEFFGRCHYCLVQVKDTASAFPQQATAVLRVPVSKGGKRKRSNLALSCRRCKEDRKDRTEEEYMKDIYAERMRRLIEREKSKGT